MPDAPDPDIAFMRRAIRLAMNGRGRVEPNPMVGCAIVSRGGRVIGAGYHERYGGPHAEPNALARCTASPAGATAYVTLEPCCHTDKQTPPCVPRLIEAKLARVVIGCADPNPAVDGKGAAMLRAAGIRVDVSGIEPACRQLIAPFVARVVHGRPYVTLKWAQTADGKVAGPGGQRLQISNAASRELVHDLRSRVGAILVGVNTVLADDPALDARLARVRRDPARFVLDRALRTPPHAAIFKAGGRATTVFYSEEVAGGGLRERRDAIEAAGAHAVAVPADATRRPDLGAVLRQIFERSAGDLLVEAGPTLARSFFAGDLCDRLWVFRSPATVDDPTAPTAATIPPHFVQTGELEVEGDVLAEYLNPRGGAYVAAEASADLTLAREGG